MRDWPEGRTLGREPLSQVRRRVLDVLLRHADHDPVIVVRHGTVIEALTGRSAACVGYVAHQLPRADTSHTDHRTKACRWVGVHPVTLLVGDSHTARIKECPP